MFFIKKILCSAIVSYTILKHIVHPEPSYRANSSARAKSPSVQFSQSQLQVTQYTVRLEPSHPVYSSALAKLSSKQFS